MSKIGAYVPTAQYPNVSDTPPSVRRGFNPPVIGPDDTPAEIKHKEAVLDQLARDAADAQAAEAKRASAQASLHGILSGLDSAAVKHLESKLLGVCHDRRDFDNVIGVLREMGLR